MIPICLQVVEAQERLGIGISRQYRKDAVTVSMRAVSVLTGEVLLNVQTRKTILSVGEGGDVFRFIEEGTQLVEFEDGWVIMRV